MPSRSISRRSGARCRSCGSRGWGRRVGSRAGLRVTAIARALLYAEPIYLQAERSPMPELRLVVLALQDRLAYGPTFEVALNSLFGGASSSLSSVEGTHVTAESA